jgi:hypothetical protein
VTKAFNALGADRDGRININYLQFLKTFLWLPWTDDDFSGGLVTEQYYYYFVLRVSAEVRFIYYLTYGLVEGNNKQNS